MKVKLNEFKYAMTSAINETIGIGLPKILEDKEFASICESIEMDGEEETNQEEILKECAVQFTTGVFEEMNITKDRLDEIAFLAPWIGKLAVTALRPFITKMLAKYGAKFFASTAGKAILKKIGCKTAAQALGKLGIKTAGKAVAKKAAGRAAAKVATNAAGKGLAKKAAGTVGKKFGDGMMGKAAKWAGYTMVGNTIMGGSKNNNTSSTYEPSSDYNYNYSYAAEAIDRVFKRHFSE